MADGDRKANQEEDGGQPAGTDADAPSSAKATEGSVLGGSEGAKGDARETEKTVDEDWKAEARREREKLARAEEEQKRNTAEGGPAEMPPADFLNFVSGMAAQVLMQLGAIPNPIKGEKAVDLAAARYSIDVLQMLADKTKGNLSDEEDSYLRAALHDLRMRFVESASPREEGRPRESGVSSESRTDG